ncbi:MAG: hypothetical protein KDI17_14350 [Halioglobus sp.]|nr:hypothetical protein [Halioglobus sp.]
MGIRQCISEFLISHPRKSKLIYAAALTAFVYAATSFFSGDSFITKLPTLLLSMAIEWPWLILYFVILCIISSYYPVFRRPFFSRLQNENSDNTAHHILIESDTLSLADDLLKRKEIAEGLASVLTKHVARESLVIGISGEWGTGKSTLINYVKETIRNTEPTSVIIEFNPWTAPNSISLSTELINKIALELAEKEVFIDYQALAKSLIEFSNLVLNIAGKSSLTKESWFSSRMSDPSELVQTSSIHIKQKIESQICHVGAPIVVVIDDIDRLSPEDTRTMFQIIKGVCNFRGINYMVAYDREQASKSLSYNGVYDGSRYIEKIIQIEIPLPTPLPSERSALLASFLKEFVSYNPVDSAALSKGDKERSQEALNIIASRMSNVRDIKRLVNRLVFKLGAINKGIDFYDVLLFSYLQQKFPEVCSYVEANVLTFIALIDPDFDYYPGIEHYVDLSDYKSNSKEDRSVSHSRETEDRKMEKMLRRVSLDEPDIQHVEDVLTTLFPAFAGVDGDQTIAEYRLGTMRNFAAFSYDSDLIALTKEDVKSFLVSRQLSTDMIEKAANDEQLSNLYYLAIRELQVSKDACSSPLEVIQSINDSKRSLEIADSTNIPVLLTTFIDTCKYEDTQEKLLEFIVYNSKMLTWSERVLLHYLKEANLWDSGHANWQATTQKRQPFTRDFLIRCKNIWLEQVKSRKTDLLDEPEFISVMFRWGQLEEPPYSTARAEIDQLLSNEAAFRRFSGRLNERARGYSLEGMEELFSYNTFEKFEDSVGNEPNSVIVKLIERLKKQSGHETSVMTQ